MTYREKTPGLTTADLPTVEQAALGPSGDPGSTFRALRVEGESVTLSTNIVQTLIDAANGAIYPRAPTAAGNPLASMIQTVVNGVPVLDGERPGNPSTDRRGYALPAAQVAGKNAISLFWVARVPASTWTSHSSAITQTFVSYIPAPQETGTVYLWRVRYTTSGVEIWAKRAIGDASWITKTIGFDVTKWHAGELIIDFVAGTAAFKVYLPDANGELQFFVGDTATGMVGTAGPSQAAGGSDIIDFGYHFYSTGSAQQFYGQTSALLVYPDAIGKWDRWGLLRHATARIKKLNGGS